MAESFQLKAIISAADKATPALKAIAKSAQGTRKYLVDIGNAASGFASKIGLPVGILSTIAAGFSIGAIKNAVTAFAEAGEAIYKGSLKAGLSVEEYQRWSYVAKQSGVEAESLTMGIGKLNRNIGLAAAGKNKDLAGLFQKLGISARDANGQLKAGADLLPDLADAFVRNKNPVVQARMGMALFGKAWQEMAPLLMEGGEGIDKMQKRFKLLKSAMDLDTVKGAKEFGDQMKDLEIVTKGFQMTIAKELVPVLSPMIEEFIQWAAANRKVVASGVKEFVKDTIAALRGIDWAAVIEGVKGFGRGIMWAVDMVGGFRNALIGLIVFMNIEAIMAFVGLGSAIVRTTWSLGAMAVSAIASAVPAMGTLAASLTFVTAAAGVLLVSIAAIAAAFTVAYQAGKWLYEKTALSGWIANGLDKITGLDARTAEALAPTGPGAAAGSPNIVGGGTAKVGGAVKVEFANAPAGMRVVESQGSGGLTMRTDVGYNSDAMGAAY